MAMAGGESEAHLAQRKQEGAGGREAQVRPQEGERQEGTEGD